ncbi:MAG: 3-dehydroquinate synthase [Deltaproteobacteria bacterium]|nr:3-dehydroquinate synthase [Deltaproteobacteria bacterium]
MKEYVVRGLLGDSRVLVGESLDSLAALLPERGVLLVTDENVDRLYGDRLPDFPKMVLPPGEAEKTLDTAREVYRRLVRLEAGRDWFLCGVGGGVVCDLVGFVASTYVRGMGFGFCATTLLAQVDASVGGKNGVNFEGYKNLVGAFNQPRFVVCDPAVLATLPEEEAASGLAEVVKHAAIADPDLFTFLEENAREARGLAPEAVLRMVGDSVRIKSAVVSEDEREAGRRKVLNFGHTLGHALEKAAGVSHGYGVSAGMAAAARLSVDMGLLAEEEARRLENLLLSLGLPLSLSADRRAVADALLRDKKRAGDTLDYVLLSGLGTAVARPVPVKKLLALLGLDS